LTIFNTKGKILNVIEALYEPRKSRNLTIPHPSSRERICFCYSGQ
jgi:hypothetical protein